MNKEELIEILEDFKSQIMELIEENQEEVMSAISDFATKQNAFNDKMDTAITGLTTEIKDLNDLVAKLQASPGSVSAADQALLDALTARGQSISDKLTALNALTPPVPPVA